MLSIAIDTKIIKKHQCMSILVYQSFNIAQKQYLYKDINPTTYLCKLCPLPSKYPLLSLPISQGILICIIPLTADPQSYGILTSYCNTTINNCNSMVWHTEYHIVAHNSTYMIILCKGKDLSTNQIYLFTYQQWIYVVNFYPWAITLFYLFSF